MSRENIQVIISRKRTHISQGGRKKRRKGSKNSHFRNTNSIDELSKVVTTFREEFSRLSSRLSQSQHTSNRTSQIKDIIRKLQSKGTDIESHTLTPSDMTVIHAKAPFSLTEIHLELVLLIKLEIKKLRQKGETPYNVGLILAKRMVQPNVQIKTKRVKEHYKYRLRKQCYDNNTKLQSYHRGIKRSIPTIVEVHKQKRQCNQKQNKQNKQLIGRNPSIVQFPCNMVTNKVNIYKRETDWIQKGWFGKEQYNSGINTCVFPTTITTTPKVPIYTQFQKEEKEKKEEEEEYVTQCDTSLCKVLPIDPIVKLGSLLPRLCVTSIQNNYIHFPMKDLLVHKEDIYDIRKEKCSIKGNCAESVIRGKTNIGESSDVNYYTNTRSIDQFYQPIRKKQKSITYQRY